MKAKLVGLSCVVLLSAGAAHARTEGSYVVPSSDSLDTPVEVDLKRARFRFERRGRVKFDYKLPKILAGENSPRFSMRGNFTGDGPWKLAGDGVVESLIVTVNADCRRVDADQVDCRMVYDKKPDAETGREIFPIDVEGAAAYVAGLDGVSAERALELYHASLALRDEAIGIVKIKLR